MLGYKALNRQNFTCGSYSLVPIRYSDKYEIMKWRNDQIYHLRQSELLNKEKQDHYFNSIISKQFAEEKPNQILFSYLHGQFCIGYGGLVNIDWESSNAEISFLINTELLNTDFKKHWSIFLSLIEEVAFLDISLHKIYTYAFDLRPLLYEVLEENNYLFEARLIDQKKHENNYIDIIIHSKIKI